MELLIHGRSLHQHQTTGYPGDRSGYGTIITGPVTLPEITGKHRGAGDERLWQPGVTTALHPLVQHLCSSGFALPSLTGPSL